MHNIKLAAVVLCAAVFATDALAMDLSLNDAVEKSWHSPKI